MSLYNVLHGHCLAAGFVLHALGLVDESGNGATVPRFRDAYCELDTENDTVSGLVVLARIGGGNREDYAEDIAKLQAHPDHLSDEDDEFDPTFAVFRFRVPEGEAEEFQKIYDTAKERGMFDRITRPSLREMTESAARAMGS